MADVRTKRARRNNVPRKNAQGFSPPRRREERKKKKKEESKKKKEKYERKTRETGRYPRSEDREK